MTHHASSIVQFLHGHSIFASAKCYIFEYKWTGQGRVELAKVTFK